MLETQLSICYATNALEVESQAPFTRKGLMSESLPDQALFIFSLNTRAFKSNEGADVPKPLPS
jgi:hypothetical protein